MAIHICIGSCQFHKPFRSAKGHISFISKGITPVSLCQNSIVQRFRHRMIEDILWLNVMLITSPEMVLYRKEFI